MIMKMIQINTPIILQTNWCTVYQSFDILKFKLIRVTIKFK